MIDINKVREEVSLLQKSGLYDDFEIFVDDIPSRQETLAIEFRKDSFSISRVVYRPDVIGNSSISRTLKIIYNEWWDAYEKCLPPKREEIKIREVRALFDNICRLAGLQINGKINIKNPKTGFNMEI